MIGAELAYESFLASLKPDFIYITSLFEDINDNVVTSVHRLLHNVPVAVTLYDVIPYLYPKSYLENPVIKAWYFEKIEHLKKADLLLSISETSRRDGIVSLGLSGDCVVNISTDADTFFKPVPITSDREAKLREKYGLTKSFILCTGGIDARKNIEAMIRSFGKLPQSLRNTHQLALVFHVPHPARQDELMRLVEKRGLNRQDVVLTGYVPDEDLLIFYNLCKLFVFPSWYEGFGLPALEAMRCGAPVIGANTSSLPEVIGWDEALFDPHSDKAIAQAIERGLSDESFRQTLLEHCQKQTHKFSWDESARRAIAAMERRREQWDSTFLGQPSTRLKLAYVSPLPPIRSGVTEFSAKLLPELSKFYDIDVVVTQSEVTDNWIIENCPVRSSEWLRKNSRDYDRVLYHFGNSEPHKYMLQLPEEVPGVVVLHDFFLSGILAHMELNNQETDIWRKSLYESHGYIALHDRQNSDDLEKIIWKYPCNRDIVQCAVGIVLHSEEFQRLASHWYGNSTNEWPCIPPNMQESPNICAARYYDVIERYYRFFEGHISLLASAIATQVGDNDNVELIKIAAAIGRNLPPAYRAWQLLVDVSIPMSPSEEHALMPQLKAWLELPPYGCRVEPVYRTEDGNYHYAREFTARFLGHEAVLPDDSVEYWAGDVFMRTGTDLEFDSLQKNEIFQDMRQHGVALRILANENNPLRHEFRIQHELARVLAKIEENNQTVLEGKQLFVDISVLLIFDPKTGIQRVVRSLLNQLSLEVIKGFRIEPVYEIPGHQGYFYARHLFAKGRNMVSVMWDNGAIKLNDGDIYLSLDLNHQATIDNKDFYQIMRANGVQVKFIVYDLLPVLLTEFFDQRMSSFHEAWLRIIAQCDGAICISKSVADELKKWLSDRNLLRHGFCIEWFHLGADIETSVPSSGMPDNAQEVLDCISSRETFLMVGTVEPRKGHQQVLAAFELLWERGACINLVIVGKKGWMMEKLFEKILKHNELGSHLFWIDNASDEYLESIYSASDCLIVASKGEGFGLPIIEAARHKLPIITRDIPVFREVAGDNAVYFSGGNADDLAGVIEEWMDLHKQGNVPDSRNIAWLTWKQSTELLLEKLMKD